jgi:hypothetical protein
MAECQTDRYGWPRNLGELLQVQCSHHDNRTPGVRVAGRVSVLLSSDATG